MARKREPKYRLQAYDGDYKSRNLLPDYSGGHRLHVRIDKKAEVLAEADAWMAKHPPQKPHFGSDQEPYVMIHDRNGDQMALWKAKDGAWEERYNFLSRRRNAQEIAKKLKQV